MKKYNDRRQLRTLFMLQSAVCLSVAMIFLLFRGAHAAGSSVIAGLTAVAPNMIFADIFFRFRGARAARRIVKSFYMGEAVKLFVTFTLFALVFMFVKVDPLAFFITYVLVLMTIWFAPLILD